MHAGRKLKPAFRQLGPSLLFILSSSTVGIFWITYQTAHSTTPVPAEPPEVPAFEDEDPATMRFRLLPNRTKDLIFAINEATRVAGGGSEPADLTSEERERWGAANPCQSRLGLRPMYARRKFAPESKVSEDPGWDLVLEEYSKLHRICRQRVGNPKEYFLAGNTSIAGCRFSIADYSEGGGLGNKILAVANTVLYSILTQRVVLVPTETLVPALMCEPFPGSSWVLEAKGDDPFPLRRGEDDGIEQWTLHKEVYEELDSEKGSSSEGRGGRPSKIYASAMLTLQYQPESRFFCDAEQASFAGVTWLHFSGCLYLFPRFFSVPAFRATLEALFPDKMVLTRVARTVMLPDDLVWERFLRNYAAHMKDANRRVGVQIRYRRNMEQYEQMNDVINERVLQCALENRVLPKTVDYNETAKAADRVSSSSVVKVFVASLYDGFSDMLSQKYLPRPTASGEVVGIVQLSHQKRQTYGLDEDRQSLVEILMLSFSDALFVTPLSTFGGLAQAYGALVPWIIDFRIGRHFGPCGRAQTVDLCYQEADFTYACPHDPDIDGKVISEVVPYISDCLAVDTEMYIKPGFQLITENSSD